MRHRAVLLSLLILSIGLSLARLPHSVTAQDDGLSDEQLELIDRYFEGTEKRADYSTYVQTEQSSQHQLLVFSSTGLPEFTESNMDRQEIVTVIQAESPEIRSEITVAVSQDRNYSLEAEVRIVDGVMYVNAAYVNQYSDLPLLPDGWVIVDNGSEWEGLAPLQLHTYVDNRASPLSDRELLLDGLTDVTLESAEREDGSSVDVIVMTFTKEAIAGLLTPSETGEESAVLASILDNMLDASVVSVRAYLDDDNHIVQVDTHIRLLSEVDLDQIEDMSFPAGTTMTFDGTFDNSTIYSQINDMTLTPVGAPDLDNVAYYQG